MALMKSLSIQSLINEVAKIFEIKLKAYDKARAGSGKAKDFALASPQLYFILSGLLC
jgi:hypothetical protein